MFDLVSRLRTHSIRDPRIPDRPGDAQMRQTCADAIAEIEWLRELLRVAMDSRAPDMVVAAGYTYWPQSVREALAPNG